MTTAVSSYSCCIKELWIDDYIILKESAITKHKSVNEVS